MIKIRKSLRVLVYSFVLVVFWVGPLVAADVTKKRGPTLVELYTSQGCSSCPPADALLGKLAKSTDVLALSFHVDYWDYIGWKDPFAASIHSVRQQEYSRVFRKSYVYTPQIIVHGMLETTGSNEAAIQNSIARAKLAPDVPIQIKKQSSGDVTIQVARGKNPGKAFVWLAFYDPLHKTKIRRGENRGVDLNNYNVVRKLTKVGEWQGKRVSFTIPAAEIAKHTGRGCAVFLQAAQKGPILGTAVIQLAEN